MGCEKSSFRIGLLSLLRNAGATYAGDFKLIVRYLSAKPDLQMDRVLRTLEEALRTYIQSDEAAWEDLLPAVELAHICITHISTGLSSFEVMISGDPLRASDLHIVDAYDLTLTPAMSKLLQRLVKRAAATIINAQAQQQSYPREPAAPAESALRHRDKPRPMETLPPQGWEPAEDASEGAERRCEVERILDSRTRNGIKE
ncbi:hypothetical protein Efla_005735 [Eimeria flavescens]